MNSKMYYWKNLKGLIISITVVLLILLLFVLLRQCGQMPLRIGSRLIDDISNFNIYISPTNDLIKNITADSSNRFLLKVKVTDDSGLPVENVPISVKLNNPIGIIRSKTGYTDKFGELLVTYIPPDSIEGSSKNVKVSVSAEIINWFGIDHKSKLGNFDFNLVPVPIILVPGYQATTDTFASMISYFDSLDINTIPFNYDTEKGILFAAEQLKIFLKDLTDTLYLDGLQAKRFDIVAHSMGGLVSRYYSVSNDYIEFNNIRKLIFLSTPHKGSHLAPIGAKYFDDDSVKDMMPDSELFTSLFPKSINKGLNPYIYTGNIIGQFDEVVSIENASLKEWGISTMIFNIGSNNLNVDSFLDGTISQTAIHKLILSNTKVYETIVDMLTGSLFYPSKVK